MNQVAELRAAPGGDRGDRRPPPRPVPPPLTPLEAFEQTPPPTSPRGRATTAAHRSRRGIRRACCAVRAPEQAAGGAGGATAAAAATRSRLRGNRRHPLGGVDRRADAGARRVLHGSLFDRGRPARPRRAHDAGRPVRAGAACSPANGPAARKASPPSRQLPIANIPAILTAAGTAVAFATVYAAYALYGFLVPATAFILLGLVALGTLAAALLHGPALAGLGVVGAFVTPDPGFIRQAGLLGALCLSRHRHRGGVRSGARQAVALACGHHDRVRAVVDLPLPAMRPVDGRPACVPCARRFHPRRVARGVRLHVRPARGRRPGRADLVGLARGLSASARL